MQHVLVAIFYILTQHWNFFYEVVHSRGLISLTMQAAFLFTVVGTTGFLGVLAGQLPGVSPTLCFFIYAYMQ